MSLIVVDIDGTISDATERQKFLTGPKKDWKSFHDPERIAAEPRIEASYEPMLRILASQRHRPVLLTGRPEELRRVTEWWLYRNYGIAAVGPAPVPADRPFVELFMRPSKDYSSSLEYKTQIVRQLRGRYGVAHDIVFIDDDLRNREMYTLNGIFLHAPECWKTVFF